MQSVRDLSVGAVGAFAGAMWSIALGSGPASGCPAPSEGRTQCVLQHVWLAGLTRVLVCGILFAVVVRVASAAPEWLRARREGRLVALGAQSTPDDEILLAACWGYHHEPEGRTVVRRATRLRWDRTPSAGRGPEPRVQ